MLKGEIIMTNKNKVIVRIMGQEYTMVGSESREYMQKIANFVDDKMVDIARNTKKLSTAMVAVLTALNIGDEYFKIKKQLTELEKAAMLPIKDLEHTKSQLEVTKVLLAEQEEKFAETLKKLENNKQMDTENDKMNYELLNEVEQLKSELKIKEDELIRMEKSNDDLLSKLFNCQIKYVQSRKELDAFIETFEGDKK